MAEKLEKVNAEDAMAVKYPSEITAVSSVDSDGIPNALIVGWSMIVSGRPPMMAIAIGHPNYSCKLIRECGEFALAYPSTEMVKQAEFCGSNSGRNIEDKLSECGWKTMPATVVAPPLLGGCLANFECMVKDRIETGDHTTFIGEVVAAHRSTRKLDRLYSFADGALGPVRRK